jgi:hypothetical protein
MVVSSAMRIGTQDLMFRTGMVTAVGAEKEREREIGGAAKSSKAELTESTDDVKPTSKGTTAPRNTNGTKGSNTNGKGGANGRRPASGKRPTNTKAATNGKAASNNGSTEDESTTVPKPHPRSRSKKERKAR